MKKIIFLFLSGLIISCAPISKMKGFEVKEQLWVPFGTIVNIKGKIVIGNDDYLLGSDGLFLLKISSINNIKLNKVKYMFFEDRTGYFPNNEYDLAKLVYGEKPTNLSSKERSNAMTDYIGKKIEFFAYESGSFQGIPENYILYQPTRTGRDFFFNNYLVIVKNVGCVSK